MLNNIKRNYLVTYHRYKQVVLKKKSDYFVSRVPNYLNKEKKL